MIISILLLCVVWTIPCINGFEYHFINQKLSWHDAQQFCRLNYLDLATVTSVEEAGALNRLENYTGLAWIGLYDVFWKAVVNSDSWRWSATGKTTWFSNWKTNYPAGVDLCVSLGAADGMWFNHYCDHPHNFLCYTAGQTKQYHYFATTLTWANAVLYCRQHYTDLALIESSTDSDKVNSVVSTTGSAIIWIGLYREPKSVWTWSDRTIPVFTRWGTNEAREQCAAEDSAHLWFPQSCDQTLPFFCHGAKKKKSKLFRIKFQSDLDMTSANNYIKMLQQMEEHLKQKGLTDVSITIKTSTRKPISKKLEVESCI